MSKRSGFPKVEKDWSVSYSKTNTSVTDKVFPTVELPPEELIEILRAKAEVWEFKYKDISNKSLLGILIERVKSGKKIKLW